MKTRKWISLLIAGSMFAAAATSFAAAPAVYDSQSYDSVGLLTDDTDGEINLAVTAKGDVEIGNGALIEGSVYSNGEIKVKDFVPSDAHVMESEYAEDDYPNEKTTPEEAQAPEIKGMFISGVQNNKQYVVDSDAHVYLDGYYLYDDNGEALYADDASAAQKPNYAGGVYDGETSFDCEYTPFEVPQIANEAKSTKPWPSSSMADITLSTNPGLWNKYDAKPRTFDKDTYMNRALLNGGIRQGDLTTACLTIDTSKNDVSVVINQIADWSGNMTIKVIGDHEAYLYINNFSYKQSDPAYLINHDYINSSDWPASGNPERTHVFISGDEVDIRTSYISAAEVKINTNTFRAGRKTKICADNISTNAKNVGIHHGGYIEGTLCAPYADTNITQNGTLKGQLHTNTLKIDTYGKILYKQDSMLKPTPEPEVTPEPPQSIVPDSGYAYIFGYEPKIVKDENGKVTTNIYMAPQDDVTREQVAAMITRMLDQLNGSKPSYKLTDNIAQYDGTWFVRGLACLNSKGAFGSEIYPGPITRGEVAKLIVKGFELEGTTAVPYADVAGNIYEEYIATMYSYGLMTGTSDTTFEPDRVMTRAEFCKLFNNIIGRDGCTLSTADGTVITPATYSIVDIDSGAWYYKTVLKATSSYDDNGNVDLQKRADNIRNKLDDYDSQLLY